MKPENVEHRAHRDRQARRGQRGLLVLVVRRGHRVHRGQPEQQDLLGHKESAVFRGLPVLRAREVKPEPEVKKETPGTPAAHRDQRVIPDLLALPVKKVNPVSEGHRDYRDHRVLPEREVRQANRERRVKPENPDLLVLRGSPVHRDLKVTGASQDLQAHRDRRESGDLRGLGG